LRRIRGTTVAALAAVAVVGAFAAHAARASLQQDFAAYWTAGAARRLGLDPYLNHVGGAAAPALWDGVAPFRHSRFLYPPLVAELCRPLAALPYGAAKALFTAAAVGAWVAAALLCGRRAAAVVLVAGALFFPLYAHLERGQIDLFALPLLVAAWRRRDRALLAGAALAAAATLKPALLGALPVLAALGRWRWAAAALGGTLAVGALTVVICGPGLLAEYHATVLPRALLYGEGGTEAMLLPSARFPPSADGDAVVLDGRDYRQSLWELPLSASWPRLLAPRAPTRPSALGPYVVSAAALVVAARQLARRRRPAPASAEAATPETLLAGAAVIACVVTSPTGWVMGLVWALPLAPLIARALGPGRAPPALAIGLAASWLACALPPLVPGFAAVAGAALAIASATLALRPSPEGAA
jgi:hypothetical protein